MPYPITYVEFDATSTCASFACAMATNSEMRCGLARRAFSPIVVVRDSGCCRASRRAMRARATARSTLASVASCCAFIR